MAEKLPLEQMTLAQKVEKFITLRDHKTKAKKEFDKSMARVNQGLEVLEGSILAALQEQGLKNVKTDNGTAYMNTMSSATVKDRDIFEAWAKETGNSGAMDIRANKKAIRELLDEGIEEVPGVTYSERITIGVRRS
jgi:hypothetical protein